MLLEEFRRFVLRRFEQYTKDRVEEAIEPCYVMHTRLGPYKDLLVTMSNGQTFRVVVYKAD